MFLTHSHEALEIEKFKRSRKNKVEFAYDYGNLNASYVNEKINFEDDYFQDIINPDFKKIDSPFQQTSSLKPYVPNVILEKIIIDSEDEVVNLLEKEKSNMETIESLKSKGFESGKNVSSESENQIENDCLVVEKEYDKEENPKQTSSLKPYVSNVILEKIIIDLEDEVVNLFEKEKANLETIESLKSKDFKSSENVSSESENQNLDTSSSVRRPKNRGVIWKKKGSSNTSNVALFDVSDSKLNKNVKRYFRKDLLACNNSHLEETSSASVCNDAMNVSCNSRMCDLLDDNNFFIFDDECVKISPVSKMFFRKKPRDSMHVRSKSNMIKSLPRTVHKWLPKLQPLAEPVAKWFPRIVQICLWIFDSVCSKHMTGNRALLTNFVEKFLGTVRFGNNDFAVIAGYGDVVIGSMMIKKVYYVEGLGRNLFSVGQFCDKGLELVSKLKFLIKMFPRRSEDEDSEYPFFEGDVYDTAIEDVIEEEEGFVEKGGFGGCYLLNDYEDVGKLKAKGDIGVFVGYLKESVAFRIYNKRTRKIHESVNVNFDEISKMASKQFSLELGLSNLNETRKSSNTSVSQVSKTSKKDLEDLFQKIYDEYFDSSKIMKSSTTNVENSINEEVFHEVSESFQGESSSSSLNDDVQQSPEEVILPQTNTQSISNNMIPNGNEASTSHNVFNE
nr:hypothetical protein [Tanacetum cinerariifolium]